MQNQNENEKDKNEQEVEALSEDLNFNNPNFEFIPKGSHEWTQRGYYLICRSCELEHAVWIGPDKLMVGTREGGEPILKDRT